MKKDSAQEIIFGIHPIQELFKAKKRRLLTIYTTKPVPRTVAPLLAMLPKNVSVQYVDRTTLSNIAQTTDHQGIVAYATPFVYKTTFFNPTHEKKILFLDGIQDVRNLGAIIRSAYCTNFDGIIITKKHGASLTAAAIKASAGFAEHMSIYQAPSAAAALQLLQKAQYTLYLAVVTKGVDATTVSYTSPLCLVIGSEASGISPELLPGGTRITLPQKNSTASYNASVAAGILLFLVSYSHH